MLRRPSFLPAFSLPNLRNNAVRHGPIVVITNNPAPYRIPVFDLLQDWFPGRIHVLYCTSREPNREWTLPPINHPHEVLSGFTIGVGVGYVHFNSGVVARLRSLKPAAIVTCGYQWASLCAFLFARARRIPHIAMTDGTLMSEKRLTWLHRILRSFVLSRSKGFIAASEGGRQLFAQYECPQEATVKSCLAIDRARYGAAHSVAKEFDILFVGRFSPEKNPSFVLRVAERVAPLIGRKVRVAFLGSGGLQSEILECAQQTREAVETSMLGFAQANDLPLQYGRARILAVPSLSEPWGVVINEAMASRVPVVASDVVGAVGDLLLDGVTGLVAPLNEDLWAERIQSLLLDKNLYDGIAERAYARLSNFTHRRAAAGFARGVERALAPHVALVQRRLPEYRAAVFDHMRRRLREQRMVFRLIVGTCTATEEARRDEGALRWAEKVRCRYLLGERAYWQNVGRRVKSADLVILPQENRSLYNVMLLLSKRRRQIALWGHGRNWQRQRRLFDRLITRILSLRVDWWFAYTALSAEVIRAAGVPRERITITNNSARSIIDVIECAKAVERCKGDWLKSRAKRSVLRGAMLGSLHEGKSLDTAIEVAKVLSSRSCAFELHIIGDGPGRAHAMDAALRYPFIHFHGRLAGKSLNDALLAVDFLLIPRMGGLNILDGFALGLPTVAIQNGFHSPEIAYVSNNVNGCFVGSTVDEIAQSIESLQNQPGALQDLARGSLSTASLYTSERMVSAFCQGIERCLSLRE